MNQSLNTSLINSDCKDNKKPTQIKIIFEYLKVNIATASMVSEATEIAQKNITRYKRKLELAGRLWEIEKKLCKKTGFRAWYLSANPEHKPKHLINQLSLF
ncbi:MAG: hypothetical protein AB7O47_01515 [Flavobacteriales bacterium]